MIAALTVALMVFFIWVTTWPGMIFEKVGDWTENKLGEDLNKPILGCPICMTPWWGTIIYISAHFLQIPHFETLRLGHVIFTVFTAAGINSIFLMFNKQYDVAKKEDVLLADEIDKKS